MSMIKKITIAINDDLMIDLTPEQAKVLLASLKEIFEQPTITKWIPIERPYVSPYEWPPWQPYVMWTSGDNDNPCTYLSNAI